MILASTILLLYGTCNMENDQEDIVNQNLTSMKRKLYQLMLFALIVLGVSLFVLQGCKKEEEGVVDWLRDTQTQIVDVTNPTTGKTWMDRNLGASRAATSSTDAAAYGDLYQWGRAADGHQKRNSGTKSIRSKSDNPGHGSFITMALLVSQPYDWRNPPNDNLWQGVNGVNNPCPPGYRMPTEAEWQEELLSWSSNDAAGAFASPLKLPLAGYRYSGGSLGSVGVLGQYWSSTAKSPNSSLLSFGGAASTHSYSRARGYSVRCIKDD